MLFYGSCGRNTYRTLLFDSSQSYSFSNWRVAFEVDLKLVDAKEESISDVVLKRFGRKGHHAFKQLVLDFSSKKHDRLFMLGY